MYRNTEVKLFFDLEKRRHALAISKKIKDLRSTYMDKFPELKNENSGVIWDKLNSKSDYSCRTNPMAYERIRTAVGYVAKKKMGIKILDIGFGSADFEKMIYTKWSNNINLTGIDISEGSVVRARKSFPNWSFITGSTGGFKNILGNYDYIVALEVFEHISPSKIIGTLKTINRILRSDGKLIVSVPLNEGLEEMVKLGNNPNFHVRAYTKEILLTELEMGGFRILRYKPLYAFHKYYKIKSVISRISMIGKKPNNLIVLAQKK